MFLATRCFAQHETRPSKKHSHRRSIILRASQARARNSHSGEPILSPFRNLNDAEVFLRKDGVILVAGGPGTGKTALVQSLVQRGDGKGKTNSVLYFSADSSPWDLYSRAAAIATGRELSDIEHEIKRDGPARLDVVVNDATKHMWMDFKNTPDDNHIADTLEAYAEIHGAYPEIVVMDNLKDCMVSETDDEWKALEDAMMFLKEVAKTTHACVIALHHVSGALEDGYSQIPLSGLRGKVGKTPAMVLTLHRELQGQRTMLNVSVVKQRSGRADASGRLFYPLLMDLSSMSFVG